MGYRHGPKSFVDDKTLVFDLVHNDPYTRQYDLDILNEIAGDEIALHTVAIQQDGATKFEGESFTFGAEYAALPEACLLYTSTAGGRPPSRGRHPGHLQTSHVP